MVSTAKCVHHWMIDAPDVDTETDSEGTCKKCHTTMRFSNATASSEWYGYNKTRPWTKDIAKATTRQKRQGT